MEPGHNIIEPSDTAVQRQYYAIAKGRQIGIFKAAPAGEYNRHIRRLTNGYSDNIHRGFSTLHDALIFMKNYNFATVTLFDHLMNRLEVYALQISSEPVLFRKREDSVTDKEDEQCKICGDTVDEDDSHPQCEVCDKWLHLPCTGLTRSELPVNEYVCEQCFNDIDHAVQDERPETNLPTEKRPDIDQSDKLDDDGIAEVSISVEKDSEISFEDDHSIAVEEIGDRGLTNNKKQMDYYIGEIKRLTQENEEMKAANKEIDLLKKENERLTEQVTELIAKEHEYEKTNADNLRLIEENLKLKNQRTEEMTKSKTSHDIDDVLVARLRRIEEKQEAADIERRQQISNLQKDVKKLKEELEHKDHNNITVNKKRGGGAKRGWEGIKGADGEVVINNKGWEKQKRRGGRKNKPPTIKLIADSHGRDMKKFLGGAEVDFKPGARMQGVVETAGSVGKETCLVVMGGTNDVTEEGVRVGLKDLKTKIGDKKNVVVVGVPQRYDLDPRLCQGAINRKNDVIKSFCDFYKLKYLNIDDSRREYFTGHGLHFKYNGKKWLAGKIQTAVNSFL